MTAAAEGVDEEEEEEEFSSSSSLSPRKEEAARTFSEARERWCRCRSRSPRLAAEEQEEEEEEEAEVEHEAKVLLLPLRDDAAAAALVEEPLFLVAAAETLMLLQRPGHACFFVVVGVVLFIGFEGRVGRGRKTKGRFREKRKIFHFARKLWIKTCSFLPKPSLLPHPTAHDNVPADVPRPQRRAEGEEKPSKGPQTAKKNEAPSSPSSPSLPLVQRSKKKNTTG